jgi:hypothetical protein
MVMQLTPQVWDLLVQSQAEGFLQNLSTPIFLKAAAAIMGFIGIILALAHVHNYGSILCF